MKFFQAVVWTIFLSFGMLSPASAGDAEQMKALIERAYNFDPEAFSWFESDVFNNEEPMHAFIAATASYWLYQSDRIEQEKRDHAEAMLNRSIDAAEVAYKKNKSSAKSRFLYGVSRCNRSRFYVEESSWFRAYLDAREGLGILRDLIEDEPEFIDAQFAVGVAECFLSDAPAFLKPMARLLGFRGSAEEGIEKLENCIEKGEWTSVEATYYLGYYYYNVAENGEQAISVFEGLRKRFPKNPLFAYFLGRAHQINHDPLAALAVYYESRDISYEVGADDIGHWSAFRIGTILQGEHRHEDAIVEYGHLQGRLNSEMHHQEYFFLLPLKMAECLISTDKVEKAKMYLNVIRPEWDKDTYKKARQLLRDIDG